MRRPTFSPARALQRLGFKQALRGAIIIGFVSSLMLVGQGLAYQEAYPDEAARTKFAASLEAAPALGLIYGDAKNLEAGANGYMVYRVVGFMGLVTAVWGLFATTRLLRGSEEDGRWESARSGAVTARTATLHVATGFLYAWTLSFSISTVITGTVGASSDLGLPFGKAVVINLLIFLPALLFAALGVLTSQLALTRRRAIMYGLVPMVALFFVRGIGNTNLDLHWLMTLTPFGWTELVSPIIQTEGLWLLPFIVFISLFTLAGIFYSRRDIGSSIIKESETTRPQYWLLGNSWQLALRQNLWIYIGWATITLVMTGIIASIINVAAEATIDSKSLADSVGALAGNTNDLKIAFLGAGLVFVAMVLMIMATTIVGSIRGDEAKQYLDTILVQPVRRTGWFINRLLLGLVIMMAIALAAGLLTYTIGSHQGMSLDFGKVMATSVSFIGTIGFLLGFGAFIYGLRPRFAVAAMYVVITWSFIIDLLSSAIQFNSVIIHSSLFHYLSFNLVAWPSAATFIWTIGLGLVMATLGVITFAKRDIVTE